MLRIVLCACIALSFTRVAFAQRERDEESQLLVEEAKRSLAKKDYDRAGELLDRALVTSPRRLDLYILRASIHGIEGKHDEAVSLLERARQLSPNNTRVLISLGVELIQVGRAEDGVPILEKIVATDERHFDAQVVLGHYYAKQADWKPAAKAFEAYFANRPKALAGEDSLHRYDQANSVLRSGDARGALALYKKLGEANKKDDRARLGVAWATAAISCKQAMPVLDNLGELETKYSEVSLVRGRCALKLGRLDDALSRAERYRKNAPNALAGWVLLGDVRAAQNNWKEAEAAYLHVVEKSPDEPLFALELARAERHLGRFEAAANRLKAAGPPKEYEDDWTIEYGETLLALRRAKQLEDLVAPFVAAHDDNAKAQYLLGSALYILGDEQKALGALTIAVKGEPRAVPTYVDVLNTLAAQLVKKKDLERASAYLAMASSAGGSPLTTRNFGAVLIARNDLTRAIEILGKADANDADAQYLLGRAHHAAKRYDEARTAYSKAIKLYGKDPSVVAVQRDFAASELAAGRGEEAVAILDAAVQTAPAGSKKELDKIRLAVARSAATDAMRSARFSTAVKILRSVEKTADGDALVDLRCDLALAATGAQQRDFALDLLRGLERSKAKCPFAAPADDVGVAILIAWNEDASPRRARKTLDRLESMRRRATGVAEPLLRTAAADIAVRAAAEAYASGNVKLASHFLATAKSYDRRSPEVVHDLAVIELSSGQTDSALSALANLVGEVPEARINLGIAYEKKGEPLKALQSWKAAAQAGTRFGPLKDWIEAKERFWGSP